MHDFSFLNNIDIAQTEELYNLYKKDPLSVDNSWRMFFEGYEFAVANFGESPHNKILEKEFKVINLIEAYRKRGHLFTKTNPVRSRRQYKPTLDIENFGLSEEDLSVEFHAGNELGIGTVSLAKILEHLKITYCRTIGVEYMFIRDPEKIKWLKSRMEATKNLPGFTEDEKKQIHFHLNQAVGFEKFIHKKFVGQKRFSLEGAESLIPALDSVIEKGADEGIREFVIGISHRGRLNVLANIIQKPYLDIFNEFNGKYYNEEDILGDVKYHMGYNNIITTDTGKKVILSLAPNPSHLESVSPVVEGIARARIENTYEKDYKKLAPILIHGDAAVASQGVVYEVIQMSGLRGYRTGGTIHLIINNQVGFTTNYREARSSTYCTDIAKVIKAPVFHVNGDDPEALVYTIQLAMEFRQQFHSDIFIDILCYRKHGHNEGDEPRFTQPILYKAIAKHPNTRDIYSQKLIDEGIYSKEQIKTFEKDFNDILEIKYEESLKTDEVKIKPFLSDIWREYKHKDIHKEIPDVDTGVDKKILQKIGEKINTLPTEVSFFRKVEKIVAERKQMMKHEILDWGMAELLAYGSLLLEGYPVRISGQDSERGTFSHRHASFVIEDSIDRYYPLKHIDNNQAEFTIYNSPLSEYGVLGFEYGYSITQPNRLCIWEAQFGDFHNVAQVVVDQYISSAEEKWNQMSGITLFLPHGYEGQGPEHSSARIERFLELYANKNMQIVNCTTPANFFHVLRRQLKQKYRIPLIIFTPKSLLRHPECKSNLKELSAGKFKKIIDDSYVIQDKVTQVVLCSGKLYYEILEKQKAEKADDMAIIRVEQLAPLPEKDIIALKQKYKNAKTWIWAQEEPENMGAWPFINRKLKTIDLILVSRPESGSPATGLQHLHLIRKNKILEKIFRKCNCDKLLKYCGMQCTIDKNI